MSSLFAVFVDILSQFEQFLIRLHSRFSISTGRCDVVTADRDEPGITFI